ncbi:hypothetical protein F0562_024309 [Nyssa sinensis]|uniref:Uncharacterized protein n=1 Tax=Nyssa sinensis TaxID=561372 RepID=A0A5J5BG08_9ASTE|nr:hypothetical protein F0562_024309 [Nyssa sinensis]
MAAGVEMAGDIAVAAPPVQSLPKTDTADTNTNVVYLSNGAKDSDSKSKFKMQDIVDMLSKLKLNPLAKEFFPSSYSHDRNHDQLAVDNLSPANKHSGNDGYPNNRRVNRTNFNRIKEIEETIPNSQETEENLFNSEVDSSVSSKYHPYNYRVASQTTDTTSLNSAQASEYEDAESAYNHQASSRFHSFLELQPPEVEQIGDGLSVPYCPLPCSNDYEGKLPAIPGINQMAIVSSYDYLSLIVLPGRRERDNSEAERAQHLKQIHDLQEHIQEKERQFMELQEQVK